MDQHLFTMSLIIYKADAKAEHIVLTCGFVFMAMETLHPRQSAFYRAFRTNHVDSLYILPLNFVAYRQWFSPVCLMVHLKRNKFISTISFDSYMLERVTGMYSPRIPQESTLLSVTCHYFVRQHSVTHHHRQIRKTLYVFIFVYPARDGIVQHGAAITRGIFMDTRTRFDMSIID